MRIHKSEIISLGVLLSVFFIINLFTVDKFPCVSQDEVMFTDPAANLYLGNGFTSSAWFFQGREEFWAGNLPLYSFLVYCWIKLFGFSLTAVRSFNYVLITGSALFLWLGIIRLRLLKLPWIRILAIAVILSGYGVGICYSFGRYDALNIFFCATAFFVFSLQSSKIRYLLLIIIGAFTVLSGIHLIIFGALICLILLLFVGTKFFFESVSLAVGMLIGLGLLIAFYLFNGVLDDFITSVEFLRSFSAGNLPKDASLPFLYLAALLMLIRQIFVRHFKWQSTLTYSLVVGLIIPSVMLMAGRFPTYYTWMVYIPLAIGICSNIETIKLPMRSPICQVTLGLLLVASLMGFPLQKFSATNYWQDRDYEQVESLVQKYVSEQDWVYTDFGAYYAAKKITNKVFISVYEGAMSEEEKAKINTIISAPKNSKRVQSFFGGTWQEVEENITPTKFNFLIFKENFGDSLVETYDLHLYKKI